MDKKEKSWQSFEKTGSIDDYLSYKMTDGADGEGRWETAKQGALLQEGQTMTNQTV